jgi:hypothetical protein
MRQHYYLEEILINLLTVYLFCNAEDLLQQVFSILLVVIGLALTVYLVGIDWLEK